MASPFQVINSLLQSAMTRAKEFILQFPGESPDSDWFDETFEIYDIPVEFKDSFVTIVGEIITMHSELVEDED